VLLAGQNEGLAFEGKSARQPGEHFITITLILLTPSEVFLMQLERRNRTTSLKDCTLKGLTGHQSICWCTVDG